MQPFHEVSRPVIADLDQRRRSYEQQREKPPTTEIEGIASFCAHCKNRGYLRVNVPFGHPQWGHAVECECTTARKKEAHRRRLWEQSKIDQLASFQEASFETFQFWHQGVHVAYEAAIQFAETRPGWLVIQGSNGCGKTHLAVAIAKRCLSQEIAVLFANVPELLDTLRATFSATGEESYDNEFKRMREAEVLILDDLGAEANTPWATEKLYLLFNYRYSARLATVVTTNRINLERIDPRVRSRLSDRRLVRTVVMEAQDFRQMEEG